jgi:hypothetical protein
VLVASGEAAQYENRGIRHGYYVSRNIRAT